MNTEIIVRTPSVIAETAAPHGWGDGYKRIVFSGIPVEITVNTPDMKGVCIRIRDDGSVIVTSYGSGFTISHGSVHLVNTDPWVKNKTEDKSEQVSGVQPV